MTRTSADRTAFLAEVAAMAAAEATWEKAKINIASIVAEQAAPAKPQVRRLKPADDPFAKLDLDEPTGDAAAEKPDEDAGELARSLLDMMLSNPSAGQPQEWALAADALLKLVPRIPLRSLVTIVDRLSIMESPPHLLVSKLIHDPRIEVAGPPPGTLQSHQRSGSGQGHCHGAGQPAAPDCAPAPYLGGAERPAH